MVVDCMRYGNMMELKKEYIDMYLEIFNNDFTSTTIIDIYNEIHNILNKNLKSLLHFQVMQ